jgi:hypothetical protein
MQIDFPDTTGWKLCLLLFAEAGSPNHQKAIPNQYRYGFHVKKVINSA